MIARVNSHTSKNSQQFPASLLGAILGLIAGYGVLLLVTEGVVLFWERIPEQLGARPYWYVVLLPLLAAILVYLVRSRVGDTGHSPLDGMGVHPLTPREYLAAILAILASLFGGAVLGPEVALISTGAVIGGVIARLFKVENAQRVVGASAAGAILSLFVNPILSGSASLSGKPDTVQVDQLLWAVAVALVATICVTLARALAGALHKTSAGGPHLVILVSAAVVISVSAIAMNVLADLPFAYIATSGEELISELPTLTSIATVVGLLIFKSIAYAVSLGSGFRGGPFFPAMFIGATAGLLFALILPSGPALIASITVGIVAAVIATAPMKWPIAIVLGAVLGFVFGGWALVPAAVVGAVVARAIPRQIPRVKSAH